MIYVKTPTGAAKVKPHGISEVWLKTATGADLLYKSGLSYAEVLAAISYTGTMSASEVTYANSGKFAVIKFLTSGTLSLAKSLKGDIFCVGGGGSGGGLDYVKNLRYGAGAGGGYTSTLKQQALSSGNITITVGAGGNARANGSGLSGGVSSFGTLLSANGGGGGTTYGGSGGSGGGDGHLGDSTPGGYGGSDGSGGYLYGTNTIKTNGQGMTTRAFGEPDGELFAGGGGGGCTSSASPGLGGAGGGGGGSRNSHGTPGTINKGGGGGGCGYNSDASSGGKGGSGIVMIRVPIAA